MARLWIHTEEISGPERQELLKLEKEELLWCHGTREGVTGGPGYAWEVREGMKRGKRPL
jgi:hypothetical protein